MGRQKGMLWNLSIILLNVFLMRVGGQADQDASLCTCNPEDVNTGAVCANSGQSYTSACDFRLKQGFRAEIGIRCVGQCPCDDSLLTLGIDCSTAASSAAAGLEFCATNAVTYSNENMFMCDQAQDQTLAIACPGPCPCQLADCPRILATTPSPLVAPPIRGYTLPPASMPNNSLSYATAQLNTVPGLASMNPPPPAQPPTIAFVPAPPYQPETLNINPNNNFAERPPQVPPLRGAYGAGRDEGGIPVQQTQNFPVRELHRATALTSANYNPLAEALRSVPFRLFRHLYILITVAAEGMKGIPMQIGKNMQARLPPYIREIPMEMAKSIQEALNIHFTSLAQQVKDTVEQVRLLLDESANAKKR